MYRIKQNLLKLSRLRPCSALLIAPLPSISEIPFPRLKLVRLPPSLAATLAALPSISEIPFLDSCFPAFLIESVEICAICGPS